MKQYTMFVCDICGKQSKNIQEIEMCQAEHIGLFNLEDYGKWKELNERVKECTARLTSQNNQCLRDLEELAYTKLFAFEKEHDMKGV